MPQWGQSAGTTPANVAEIAAAVAALVPDAADVQAEAEDAIDARATADAIPTPEDLQPAAAAAIAAANLPTAAQVATAVDAQARCDAAIAARQASFTTWAQTGSAAAITAASLPTAAQVATAVDAQAKCAAAIAAASLPTAAQIAATLAADAGFLAAVANKLQETLDNGNVSDSAIADEIVRRVVGVTPQRTEVTLSGAPTSGTILAAPGGGLRNYIIACWISVTVGTSTTQFVSTGGDTMGAHVTPQNGNFSMTAPAGGDIFFSGVNTAITMTKTTGNTVICKVWYYTA